MIQIPLTPDQLDQVRAKAQEQGISLAGDAGEITKFGVTAAYKYADNLFTVTIVKKPFFISVEQCENQIRKAAGLVA